MASTTERVENILFLGAEAFAKYRNILDLQQKNQNQLALSEIRTTIYPDLVANTQKVSLQELNNPEKVKFKINELTASTLNQARKLPGYSATIDSELNLFVKNAYTEGLTKKMQSILQSPEASTLTILQQNNNAIINSFVQNKSGLSESLQTIYGNIENAKDFLPPEKLNSLMKSNIKGLFDIALKKVDKTDPDAIEEIIYLSNELNDPTAHAQIEKKGNDLLINATRTNFLSAYNTIVMGKEQVPKIALNNADLMQLYQFVQETKNLSPAEIRTRAQQSSSEIIQKGGGERAAYVEFNMQQDSATFLNNQGILEQGIISFNNLPEIIQIIEQGNEQIKEYSSIGNFSTFLTKQNRTNLATFLQNASLEEQSNLLQVINATASAQLKPVLTSDIAGVNNLAGGLLELMAMDLNNPGQFLAAYRDILTTKPIRDTSIKDTRTINSLTYAYTTGYSKIGEALGKFFQEADLRRNDVITKRIKKLNQGNSNVVIPDYNRQNPVKTMQKIINRDPQNIYKLFDNGQKIYTSDNVEVTSFNNLSAYIGLKNLGAGTYRVVLTSPTMIPINLHYEDGTPVIFTINDYAKFNTF